MSNALPCNNNAAVNSAITKLSEEIKTKLIPRRIIQKYVSSVDMPRVGNAALLLPNHPTARQLSRPAGEFNYLDH